MGNAREMPPSDPVVVRDESYRQVQNQATEFLKVACDRIYPDMGWSGTAGMMLHCVFKALLCQDDFTPDDLSWGLASALANNYPNLTRAQLKKVLKEVEDEAMRQLLAVRRSGVARPL